MSDDNSEKTGRVQFTIRFDKPLADWAADEARSRGINLNAFIEETMSALRQGNFVEPSDLKISAPTEKGPSIIDPKLNRIEKILEDLSSRLSTTKGSPSPLIDDRIVKIFEGIQTGIGRVEESYATTASGMNRIMEVVQDIPSKITLPPSPARPLGRGASPTLLVREYWKHFLGIVFLLSITLAIAWFNGRDTGFNEGSSGNTPVSTKNLSPVDRQKWAWGDWISTLPDSAFRKIQRLVIRHPMSNEDRKLLPPG
ncbi:MAG: hypothetical protein ACYDBP_04495 [Leptospirales bacterium]